MYESSELLRNATPPDKRVTPARLRAGGAPSCGPSHATSQRTEEVTMEPRIVRLESFADNCHQELRGADVRLAKIETLAEGLARNSATKADVAHLESTLIKWLIGTAAVIAGLALAAARLIP